jgi:hypothetical protein
MESPEDITFATREWMRLLATYTVVHITIHILSQLKRYLKPERVASHYPAQDDITTCTRGGSLHDGPANPGTHDRCKGQHVLTKPVHVRRTQSFGLNPEDLAENVVYVSGGRAGPPGYLATNGRDGEDGGNGGNDESNDEDEDEEYSEDEHEDERKGVSDRSRTTRKQLRALYRTRAFKTWCVRNKLDSESLQAIFQRMHIYKKLREIHPASFWALCSRESLEGVHTMEVSALGCAAEYVCSRITDLSVAYLVWRLRDSLIALLVSYALIVRHWAQGRSSGAWLFHAWYVRVDEDTGRVGVLRSAIANVLEDLFVVGSLGAGALLSLTWLLFPGRGDDRGGPCRQSTGERVAGVSQVKEVVQRLGVTR